MKALAHKLYLFDNKNEHEIAAATGQSFETIFSWAQADDWQGQRQAATAASATIADNLGRQILAFQQQITNREAGQDTPTREEIDQQAKLLNGYNKLKHTSKAATAQAILNFIHFIANADEGLFQSLLPLYLQYIGYSNKSKEKETTPMATQPAPATLQTEPAQQPVAAIEPPDDPFIIENTKEHIYGEKPPFTRSVFERNKHMMKDYTLGEANKLVLFEGKMVKKGWLEHNLLQYYLPINRRYFVADENTYHQKVSHGETLYQIRAFYETNRAA